MTRRGRVIGEGEGGDVVDVAEDAVVDAGVSCCCYLCCR